MNCTFDKALVHEFAVGEATPAERSAVESHIATCDECRLDVADLRRLARDLGGLPAPEFPMDLEEILVRASIQARRSAEPVRVSRPRVLRPAWIFAFGGFAGVSVLIGLVLLLWPGRSLSPVDRLVGGGVGQGIGLLDGILRWISDLRSVWNVVSGFLSRFAPLGKVAGTVLGGINGSIWAALALGVAAAMALFWRITSPGQRKTRGVRHAKPQH